MIQVYKILHNLYDPSIVPTWTRNLYTRTKANSLKLLVERSRLDIRKFSFCNRVVEHWNSLPEVVVSSGSLNTFKSNLDKYFKEQDVFYDMDA